MSKQAVQGSIFTSYAGVNIWHIFKDDDPTQGSRTFWYGLVPSASDDAPSDLVEVIDVRDLPGGEVLDQGPCTAADIRGVIHAAIDAGILRNPKGCPPCCSGFKSEAGLGGSTIESHDLDCPISVHGFYAKRDPDNDSVW